MNTTDQISQTISDKLFEKKANTTLNITRTSKLPFNNLCCFETSSKEFSYFRINVTISDTEFHHQFGHTYTTLKKRNIKRW